MVSAVRLTVLRDDVRDHRERWEPRCVLCERKRSQHGVPVEISDDEVMVPVCELLHPGGLCPEGPQPPPGPRPFYRRVAIANGMSRHLAESITGAFGEPSKMPCATYGLDAFVCKTGSELALHPDSTCAGCYAREGFYKTYGPVIKNRRTHQAAIHHPFWVEAMIRMIWDYIRDCDRRAREESESIAFQPAVIYFRFHDSGDLWSLDHFENICAIAEATSRVLYWLPTREYGIVEQFLREGGVIPRNLTVRLSAHWDEKPPELPPLLRGLPTSTVHLTHRKPVKVGPRRNSSIECRAYTRGNFCGNCRACWHGDVPNVSYTKH